MVRDIFTDLKRHDLGAALHEREYDGSMRTGPPQRGHGSIQLSVLFNDPSDRE